MKEKELKTIFEGEMGQKGVVWWSPSFQRMRWDIFTIFDCVVASRAGGPIYFYQITTISHVSHRRRKIYDYLAKQKIFVPNAFIWGYDAKHKKSRLEKIIKQGHANKV